MRGGLTPLLLGLRWISRPRLPELAEVPRTRLDPGLIAKMALDELFLSTELFSATIVSLRDRERMATELDEGLELWEQRGWSDAPTSYHRTPPDLTRARVDAYGSLWGPYRHLRFESGYEPHPEEPGRERWLSYAPNRTAHAWLLEHPGPPRPWLVCIPGYRMGHPAVDFTGFRIRWLHLELGLNLAIPVLPLHGPRRVGRRGGDGFLSGDFVDTLHAQTQAVWDVRRLIGWLRAQRAPAVGAYGVSLGGYTTALVAALESELECVVAGNPAADFVRLLRAHAPSFVVGLASRLGFPFDSIQRLLRVVSPLTLPPSIPHARRFLYAALVDRLATPDHARDLWRHWGRPRLEWYRGSHVSFLWERKVEALLEEAFRSCGLLPERYEPIAAAVAPLRSDG
ncbi:MAG: alpha/beta hydrolase family protein [Myxococcota bacterium]